jgi:hypothetical protein
LTDERAELPHLEHAEQRHQAKVAALRAAIDEGDASGVAQGDVFARVRKILGLPIPPAAAVTTTALPVTIEV